MNDDRARIEIGFDGGQIMSALVPVEDAERLQNRLEAGGDGVFEFGAEDGRYVVVLSRVAYLKRFSRESRVGFSGV